MSGPFNGIGAIAGPGGAGMTFDPAVASDILNDLTGLQETVDKLLFFAQELVRSAHTGDFTSGNMIQASLTALGDAARVALKNLSEICRQVSLAIQNAAKNLLAQESENHHVLSKAAVGAIQDRKPILNQFWENNRIGAWIRSHG
ncbi:hypothetical protein [Williamsia sp. CHRR-6]|uniref:hypothetical protein n=1 Tax=Williamsia sp. CHRR-6 TaxID=2835871 RepID=UPI001BD9BF9D|nr:hypothetical protein [Williamsia sp. CHRR-6]MBT0567667.1 hypothetical protein [Williamsia sp. CHRR-6]